jgi:HlyD family secretion protein
MNNNRFAFILAFLFLIILAIIIFRRFPSITSLKPGDYNTANADYGPVITSVPGTGIVNPENEVLLLSPASSLVSDIQLAPGSHVARGSIILTLYDFELNQKIMYDNPMLMAK